MMSPRIRAARRHENLSISAGLADQVAERYRVGSAIVSLAEARSLLLGSRGADLAPVLALLDHMAVCERDLRAPGLEGISTQPLATPRPEDEVEWRGHRWVATPKVALRADQRKTWIPDLDQYPWDPREIWALGALGMRACNLDRLFAQTLGGEVVKDMARQAWLIPDDILELAHPGDRWTLHAGSADSPIVALERDGETIAYAATRTR